MSKTAIYDELLSVINANKTTVISVCNSVLDLIWSKPEKMQKSYFEEFLKEFDISDIEIEDSDDFFSEMKSENISPTAKEADQLGNRILSNLIKKNVSETDFYEYLWNQLLDDVLSGDRKFKTILLVRFWVDPRTPYYQLPESCTMTADEYKAALDAIEPHLKKATFIIYAGLPQRTQRASLLMSVADEIEDSSKRAVFWAVVMGQEAVWEMYRRSVDPKERSDIED